MIMKDKKMINLLDNTPNQPTKFRTNSSVEINARGTYNTNKQIKCKTPMLKSRYIFPEERKKIIDELKSK